MGGALLCQINGRDGLIFLLDLFWFCYVLFCFSCQRLTLTVRIIRIWVPQICNNDVVWRDYIIQNRIPFVINVFLVIFGIMVLFVGLMLCHINKQFIKLICVGIFSVGIGFWSLCSYDLIMVFTYDLQLKTYIEYSAFYIAPLFILLYFWGDTFITGNRIVNVIYKLLVALQVVFDIFAFVFQIAGVMHFPALLRFQHLIIIAICMGVIILTIYDIVKKQLENIFLIMGMAIMLGFGLIDMIYFLTIKYLVVSKEIHYTSILCIGTMIFVLLQLAELGVRIGKIILNDARTALLEKMAYVDDMTGLANRRRCEEIWDSLDEENSDYGIFSFDLNFLKKINDTNGHAMGALLIKSSAQVLLNIFGKVGEVGRIGGDEYVVFIRNSEEVDINLLTKQLEAEIRRTNSENPDLNLSIAYGYCSHNEYKDLNSRHIYRKADALMYDMKTAMKATRKE